MSRSFLLFCILLAVLVSTCVARKTQPDPNGPIIDLDAQPPTDPNLEQVCDPQIQFCPDNPNNHIEIDPTQITCPWSWCWVFSLHSTTVNPDADVPTSNSTPSPYRWQVLVPAIVVPVVGLLLIAAIMIWRRNVKRQQSIVTQINTDLQQVTVEGAEGVIEKNIEIGVGGLPVHPTQA